MHVGPAFSALIFTAVSFVACRRPPPPEATRETARPTFSIAAAEPPTDSPSLREGFAPTVERVRAAVVNISSVKVIRRSPLDLPFFAPPFFDFFGRSGPGGERELRQKSLGSGVIVSQDGTVVTNNHVVEGASEVTVSLADRRELKAHILGTDPKTDIAVVRIAGSNFPYLGFGDSAKVRVGDFALAIGDPLGLGQTVTLGIISAVGRGNIGIVDYEDFLQTDAAINPGNSGGALVNAQGQLIGIPTAIATSGGGQGNQGIGFAVPSNLARDVIQQIERHGHVIRGWLGVAVQDVTPTMGAALGVGSAGGALVADITEGSPAAKAALARGDVIVALNGQPVVDSRAVRMRIAESAPGSTVALTVIRDHARKDVSATLREMPGPKPPSRTGAAETSGELGASVTPLSDELRRQLGVPANATGLAVAGVEPGGRAEAAGLRAGDVIEEANRTKVRTPDELHAAVRKAGKGPLLLLVRRQEATVFLAIPAQPADE